MAFLVCAGPIEPAVGCGLRPTVAARQTRLAGAPWLAVSAVSAVATIPAIPAIPAVATVATVAAIATVATVAGQQTRCAGGRRTLAGTGEIGVRAAFQARPGGKARGGGEAEGKKEGKRDERSHGCSILPERSLGVGAPTMARRGRGSVSPP
jgi:hypothetical protein